MIHQFKNNGYYITLDVYSGAIHLTDEVSQKAIELYEKLPKEEVIEKLIEAFPNNADLKDEAQLEELFSSIDSLKEAGTLYSDDIYEEYAGKLKHEGNIIKALCLHVAHCCNLCCSYCFAGQGKFKGKSALMSFETGKRALDFLIENSGSRHNLEVDFFGGEPLLNFDVVKKLVAYGRSLEEKNNKKFRFTLTTNGILIDDDVIDFCVKEMHNVVLSLDGRKETNDRFRVDASGKGSYEQIVPKFQKLVKARNNQGYYIRGTFTHHNVDFLNDILHMSDLGFSQLSMEPVVCAENTPEYLNEADISVLFEQYELLAQEMLKRRGTDRAFDFYHYMLDLEHGPCVYKRLSGCGSGTEYMAVTPLGELYPCHQFVGDYDYCLGDIWQGVNNKPLQDKFRGLNIYSHSECKDCWAKMFCSGGCAANSYHASGDISGIYEYGCRLFKKRIECAIMLNVAEKLKKLEE